jgi:hypothetical protein
LPEKFPASPRTRILKKPFQQAALLEVRGT